MSLLDKVNALYEEGGFVKEIGIEIISVEPGQCEGALTVERRHTNPMGVIHGGCMFALMDTIGGTAASTHGNYATTQNSSVTFLRPAKLGDRLKAVAIEVKVGRSIIVYDVEVFNQEELLMAKASFSFFRLDSPF